MRAAVSLGLAGTTDVSLLRALAPRLERLGFRALWLNDVPRGDALAGLRAVAETTSRLGLATGVIPLDRRPADTLDLAGLAVDRLVLGVGSGGARHPVALVREGIATLRERTDAPIVVGALGPRMRRLAATDGDGAVLTWLTAPAAAAAARELQADAAASARPAAQHPVRAVLYARTAVDDAARSELEAEAARYASYPNYAANFARLGIRAIDATVTDPPGLHDLDVVDEVVLRAITPNGTLAELEAFAERAATWVAGGE
ncbi:LLM class flavin-dependent oxidoreductase [Agromyces intestinalis]|uniref:LLM class flavin-dependent oxidoreductase n=1 Tax=Agromyces intestinalis TaxID=2592652 RepID=A0A5C1YFI2_9MICO|nr:LLM class flavin-dependent oxidoreductase [Agromyces intestinalis]QEO14803.1 LLM class flavin-dependent oxidoreductase [Agromyces intestinalis]